MDEKALIEAPAALEALEKRSRELNFELASEPLTGALLRALAASKPGGRLLELGTGTGVGTAWLLAGMDEAARLVSVDRNLVYQSAASEALGADKRLQLVLEDAADYIVRQKAESFDLIFADAMPGKYERTEDALRLVKPGGFYVIDDMVEQPNWPEGHAEKVGPLLELLARDERFAVAPLKWATGVVVAVRKLNQG